MNRSERIYAYPLYSLKRLPKLLKYNRLDSRNLRDEKGVTNVFMTQLDMLWCNLRYGAMGKDYVLFEFYRKSALERNTYFTTRRYYRLLKSFDKETFLGLESKSNLYQKYADFIKRD